MKKRWLNNIPYVTRSQRVGILLLALLIVVFQIIYFLYINWGKTKVVDEPFDAEWSAQQLILDSVALATKSRVELKPFNPNFISDYKGYSLGMTIEEIDKLHAYREKNQYVSSAAEFQKITGVSQQWLDSISIYFKFPQWTLSSKRPQLTPSPTLVTAVTEIKDINVVSREELMQVRGIGPVFSDRIINERNRLKGFVHMKQLNFIWGLSPESVDNLNKYFGILDSVVVRKTNVNTATLDEISKIPYINYHIAREIVIYRSNNGDLKHLKEFENIVNFPLDKLEIISLYLAF